VAHWPLPAKSAAPRSALPSFTVLPAGSKPARMNEITALTSAG
jgi:hypothetical protein